jgi:hypothetical protein
MESHSETDQSAWSLVRNQRRKTYSVLEKYVYLV